MYFGAMVLLRLTHVNYCYYILSICLVGFMYGFLLPLKMTRCARVFYLVNCSSCDWLLV